MKKFPVPHSKIPLPGDNGDGPFWEAPPSKGAAKAPRAKTEIYNKAPKDQTLKFLEPEDHEVSGIITVSDKIPPASYKRVTRYLKIHASESVHSHRLTVLFIGKKNDIHSHMVKDLAAGPAHQGLATLFSAIDLANDASTNTAFSVDGSYEIHLAPFQHEDEKKYCDYSDFLKGTGNSKKMSDEGITQFPFNNGDQREIVFEGDVGKNVLISCDIVNNNTISAVIVEFWIVVLLDKATKSAKANHSIDEIFDQSEVTKRENSSSSMSDFVKYVEDGFESRFYPDLPFRK